MSQDIKLSLQPGLQYHQFFNENPRALRVHLISQGNSLPVVLHAKINVKSPCFPSPNNNRHRLHTV